MCVFLMLPCQRLSVDVIRFNEVPCLASAGGLSQDQRLEAMSKLKQYQCRVLISTDLVRCKNLPHVYVNF